jgi:zinc transporter ZupT
MKYFITTTIIGFTVLALLFGGMWIVESVRVAWVRPILMVFVFCFATGALVGMVRHDVRCMMRDLKEDV